MSAMICEPLFHGTTKDKLESILEKGLLAMEMDVRKESWALVGPEGERDFDEGVYLTGRFEKAIEYALHRCGIEEIMVLEIGGLPRDVRLGKDGFGDLMTDKDIPAEYIRKVYTILEE